MGIVYSVITGSIKSLTRILCKVDDSELMKVPMSGPLILVSNHINFIDVPVMYTHLKPREITGFAKAETWDNPALGFLFDLWGGIPLHRGEADTKAFRSALQALRQGKILGIAPEGTRSGNGILNRGLPGILTLVKMSGAPILPLVFYGAENIHQNIRKLKQTDFHIRVGRMFNLSFPDTKMNREIRNLMMNEIMYQIAILLPQEYRGQYTNLTKQSTNFIHFA